MLPRVIRRERNSDHEAIRSLTEAAFRGMPYAGGDEQHVIDRLRKKDALTLSLVALIDDTVVGHIAFSPANASDNSQPWYALGPVSVLPLHQGNGVGSQLILEGLAQIEGLGALGCILTGNPLYYRRFAFEFAPHNVPSGEAKEYFMLKQFTSFKPSGPMHFDTAFYGDA
jgi:putative acetyltransferase